MELCKIRTSREIGVVLPGDMACRQGISVALLVLGGVLCYVGSLGWRLVREHGVGGTGAGAVLFLYHKLVRHSLLTAQESAAMA